MTIPCGGFAVLTTAWMLLLGCSAASVLIVKSWGEIES
jgi:hypothetical protein